MSCSLKFFGMQAFTFKSAAKSQGGCQHQSNQSVSRNAVIIAIISITREITAPSCLRGPSRRRRPSAPRERR